MALPAFPTDKFHKFITVLGISIAAWAFHAQGALSREQRDYFGLLTVEAAGIIEDFRTLQARATAADSLHNSDLGPSCEDVAHLRRRASILTAKGETGPDGGWLHYAFYFALMLVGQALAFLGAWAWYAAEHPPQPSTIIAP